MEHKLLRLYRRLMPGWVIAHMPSDLKDRAFRLATFVGSRPAPNVLWHWAAARFSKPEAALRHWQAIANHYAGANDWPGLMRIGQRHAILRHARSQTDPDKQARLLTQALATVAGPHDLKTDRPLIDSLAAYIGMQLPAPTAPGPKLRRVVLCVDILKTSGHYRHGGTVFQICRALMECDPALEIHLLISNEHRTAVQSPDPAPESALPKMAETALAGHFNTRFFLHIQSGAGLQGLLDSCEKLLALAPDLLLFGGGHRGPVSNESRLLRHCLFPHLPTAFFFFQCNDQVDERCDLILARGPHRIEGRPKAVPIARQPYPTLTVDSRMGAFTPAQGPVQIVSALVGSRLEARLTELGQRRLRRFLSLLDTWPGAVWHFVGAEDVAGLVARNPALHARIKRGQVVVHPMLPGDEFTQLLQQARLFLHLPGFTGGSGGAGLARRAGVPILTFRDSDVAGRQPPQTVFAPNQSANYLALARRILEDEDTARQIVALQQSHSAHLRDTAASNFLTCLHRAHALGRARL